MSEVILYLRESEGAPPLPDQRSACLDWIDDRGADLYGVIHERGYISAPLRERPKLLRLLMDLERGQTLLTIHAANEDAADRAADRLKAAFLIDETESGDHAGTPGPVVLDRIGAMTRENENTE